ncbi:hypothetical protein [Nonomuraea sp. NPDC046570]|uniref:hypothetical protein n=1 Tax=Nonomuraea sp. NPDC046570 TaxID=3155255 RepID=UPI0033C6E340
MRLAASFAILAAAGALSLTSVTPASAAAGTLILYSTSDHQEYVDPQPGCYPATGPDSVVMNGTDGRILMFPDGFCRTRVYWPVESHELSMGHTVGSIRVLD